MKQIMIKLLFLSFVFFFALWECKAALDHFKLLRVHYLVGHTHSIQVDEHNTVR